jgi:single-strand DNA-binding protein
MNRLTVIGRLVREIELKNVGDGRIVTNNTIAVSRTFKTDGKQDTDFINFVAWGKRAELLEEYCNKGDLVGLDGRLQSRTYVDDNQKTKYVVEMLVETIHFLQPKRNRNNNQQQTSQEIQTANGTKEVQAVRH